MDDRGRVDLMPERRHYPNAPIVEAIIDLAVTHDQSFSVNDLIAIRDVVEDYPSVANEYVYSTEASVTEPGDPAEFDNAPQLNGFQFTSRDKRRVFYARLEGFAFAVRAPYEDWETFRDEARRLWDVYRSITKPEGITRAAVRYINRIDIPGTVEVRLEDYLRTYPEVSRDMPYDGLLGSFFMQVQLWQEDLKCTLVINEQPTTPPDEDTSSVLLDFDFFREQFGDPWKADNDEAVWEFLEQLHDRKNEVFEANITRRTRRLIS